MNAPVPVLLQDMPPQPILIKGEPKLYLVEAKISFYAYFGVENSDEERETVIRQDMLNMGQTLVEVSSVTPVPSEFN